MDVKQKKLTSKPWRVEKKDAKTSREHGLPGEAMISSKLELKVGPRQIA